MEALFVDVGNTLLKFWKQQQQKWVLLKTLPSNEQTITISAGFQLCQSLVTGLRCQIVLCSVVAFWTQWFELMAQKYHSSMTLLVPSRANLRCALFNHQPPQQLGNDLIALAFFAANYQNALVFCLGTAQTVLIIERGVACGCLITPGITFSTTALLKKTQILDSLPPQASLLATEQLSYGVDTISAVVTGCYQWAIHAIVSWVNTWKQQHPDVTWKVIITGGDWFYGEGIFAQNNYLVAPAAVVAGTALWLAQFPPLVRS